MVQAGPWKTQGPLASGCPVSGRDLAQENISAGFQSGTYGALGLPGSSRFGVKIAACRGRKEPVLHMRACGVPCAAGAGRQQSLHRPAAGKQRACICHVCICHMCICQMSYGIDMMPIRGMGTNERPPIASPLPWAVITRRSCFRRCNTNEPCLWHPAQTHDVGLGRVSARGQIRKASSHLPLSVDGPQGGLMQHLSHCSLARGNVASKPARPTDSS